MTSSAASISFCRGGVGDIEGQEFLAAGAAFEARDLGAQVVGLDGALDHAETLPQREHLAEEELLRLDQDLLAHPDLAEVVQQARVADLLDLVAAEAHGCEEARTRSRRLSRPDPP